MPLKWCLNVCIQQYMGKGSAYLFHHVSLMAGFVIMRQKTIKSLLTGSKIFRKPKTREKRRHSTVMWEQAGVHRLLTKQLTLNNLLIMWNCMFFFICKKERQRGLVSRKQQKAPMRKTAKEPLCQPDKSPAWKIQRANTLSYQTLTAVSSYQSGVHSLSSKGLTCRNQQYSL